MTPGQYGVLLQHNGTVLAFSGHRPDKVQQFEQSIRTDMLCSMLAMEPMEVISGMALGVDTWAAEAALLLGVPLVAAIPFVGQETRWPTEMRRQYNDILGRAARVQVVCLGDYHATKMQARNEWMVERCELLLAYWDGSRGGTANCVQYARRVKRDYLVVEPRSLLELK